jgi:hypothetical protein
MRTFSRISGTHCHVNGRVRKKMDSTALTSCNKTEELQRQRQPELFTSFAVSPSFLPLNLLLTTPAPLPLRHHVYMRCVDPEHV